MAMDTDAVAVSIKDIQDAPSPKKLNRSMTSTSIPDASLPVKKLMYALLAISMGTVIEWFDFTVSCSCIWTLSSQVLTLMRLW
jgi:hypothetical protein